MVGKMHPKTAVSNLTVAVIFEHKNLKLFPE